MPFQSVVSHTVQLLWKVLERKKESTQLNYTQVDIHNILFHENHSIVHLGAFNQFSLSKKPSQQFIITKKINNNQRDAFFFTLLERTILFNNKGSSEKNDGPKRSRTKCVL